MYSLSKQSNLAGYRAAFLAGDPAIVARLLTARKHLGLMLPAPVQSAMIAALGDDEHVAAQKERYRARRATLKPALESAGFRIDHSEAGLYLWATEGRDAWESLGRLADLGILAGPGHFYGDALSRSTCDCRSPRQTSASTRQRSAWAAGDRSEVSSSGCRCPLAVSAVCRCAH